MPRHPHSTLIGAASYGVALLLIGLWPTHVDRNVDVTGWPPVEWLMHHLGLTGGETYRLVEFSANVALFVPLGVLAMMWTPRWVHAVVVGLVVSGAIEILQAVGRPDRTASLGDVLANTAGAALGAAVVLWAGRRREVVLVGERASR